MRTVLTQIRCCRMWHLIRVCTVCTHPAVFRRMKTHEGLDYNVDDSNEAMNSLNIMSIYYRLYLREAKFMFKVYNNLAPTYISEKFTLRNNVNTNMQLRSASGCFVPPKPRTVCFKHSMKYSGCLVWNSLPEEVKNAPTLDTFHNRCIQWLRTPGAL